MLSIEKSKHYALILVCFLSILLLFGCSSKDLANKTAEQIDLQKAKDFQKAGRYDLALERFETIKNKYPLSPEATEAELEIAETYYLQGSYVEALASFQSFKDLHPTHNRVDFAAFRVGMGHYQQLPDTIDRDLTVASKAVDAFNDFLGFYPKSTYVSEAREKQKECLIKLGDKEYYIGYFYFKRKLYSSAIGRFKIILQKYRNLGLDEKTLFHLGMCYY